MKLISYRWISYVDTDEKRYSDWDHAVSCAQCGRTIVHAYTVSDDDGTNVRDLGKECTGHGMGWACKRARDEAISKMASDDRRHALNKRTARYAIDHWLELPCIGTAPSASACVAVGGRAFRSNADTGEDAIREYLACPAPGIKAEEVERWRTHPNRCRIVVLAHGLVAGFLCEPYGSHDQYAEKLADWQLEGWRVVARE